jgi:hypothetical protein
MNVEKKLVDKVQTFSDQNLLRSISILAISLEGQVLGHLGKDLSANKIQSMGALLVGLWQASDSLSELIENEDEDDLKLSFQSSSSGYYVLSPGPNNPKVLWAFVFEGATNPGKIKVLSQKLRNHMDEVIYLNRNDENESAQLFNNITDEEMDKLFSFAEV